MTSKRLARLVRLKKLAEQSKAAELAEEHRQLDEAVEAAEEKRSAIESLDDLDAEATAEDLVAAQRWQGPLSKQQRAAEAAVTSQEEVVADARDEVQTAWKERRLLEGVHERAAAGEQAEADSAERKSYESIALGIYARGKGENG